MAYRKPVTRTVTILSGQTVSDVQDLRDYALVGIILPAAMTGVTMTFQVSDVRGGTYVPAYDSEGNQVSIGVAASRAIGFSGAEADAMSPFQFIKLVSGSAEGANRTIILCLR